MYPTKMVDLSQFQFSISIKDLNKKSKPKMVC